MATENAVLMQQALDSLKGKWGLAIGTIVVYFLLAGSVQLIPKAGPFLSLFITPPLALGLVIFFLSIARNQDTNIAQLFDGFKNYQTVLFAYLLMLLFILLWMILLIIPGIIAAFSYSQTFFIIADNPSIKPREALDKSKQMMDGYKWKYFLLGLRFFGWALLCILTLGIGFLWLLPYMYVSMANFYDDIKGGESLNQEEIIAPAEVV